MVKSFGTPNSGIQILIDKMAQSVINVGSSNSNRLLNAVPDRRRFHIVDEIPGHVIAGLLKGSMEVKPLPPINIDDFNEKNSKAFRSEFDQQLSKDKEWKDYSEDPKASHTTANAIKDRVREEVGKRLLVNLKSQESKTDSERAVIAAILEMTPSDNKRISNNDFSVDQEAIIERLSGYVSVVMVRNAIQRGLDSGWITEDPDGGLSLNHTGARARHKVNTTSENYLDSLIRIDSGDIHHPLLIEHAKNSDIAVGIPPYTLPDPAKFENDKHDDQSIQSLLMRDDFLQYAKLIKKEYRDVTTQTGTNPLHLCFGFIKWSASKASQSGSVDVKSPVLMMRVTISTDKNDIFTIENAGSDVFVNHTLVRKLEADGKQALPESDFSFDESSPEVVSQKIEDYLEKIQKYCKENDFTYYREAMVGLFNDTNAAVYEDLLNIKNNVSQLTKDILEGSIPSNIVGDDDWNPNNPEVVDKIPFTIYSADKSQMKVMYEALVGKSMIVQGPPGTGKSQTITNMIAQLMADGKKVLFLAQKLPALEVVKNRLEAKGFKHYLLQAFGNKDSKPAIFEAIANRRKLTAPDVDEQELYDHQLKRIGDSKTKLDNYKEFLGRKWSNTSRPIWDIWWQDSEVPCENFNEEDFDDVFPHESLQDMSDIKLDEYADCIKNIIERELEDYPQGIAADHWLRHIDTSNLDGDQIREYQSKLKTIQKELEDFGSKELEFASRNPSLFEIGPQDWIRQYRGIKAVSNYIEKCRTKRHSSEFDYLKTVYGLILQDGGKTVEQYQELLRLQREAKKLEDLEKKYIFPNPALPDEIEDRIEIQNMGIAFRDINKLNGSLLKIGLGSKRLKRYIRLYEILSNGQKIDDYFETGNELLEYHKDILNDPYRKKLREVNLDIERLGLSDKQVTAVEYFDLNDIAIWIYDAKNSMADGFRKDWERDIDSVSDYDLLADVYEDSDIGNAEVVITGVLNALDIDIEKMVSSTNKSIARYTQFIKDFVDADLDTYNRLQRNLKVLFGESPEIQRFYERYIESGLPMEAELAQKVLKYTIREGQRKNIDEEYSVELKNDFDPYQLEGHKNQLFKVDGAEKELSLYDLHAKKNVRKIYELARDVDKKFPGEKSATMDGKTEYQLVSQIQRNRQITFRNLLSRGCKTVLEYMPCFLMGPEAVAKYLPDEEIFDVVIIDEASQMKPEYAMGALNRSRQAIIIGDQHQMPPSDYFSSTYQNPNDDDNYQSILSRAQNSMELSLELNTHYRSNQEDLIRFSNFEIYGSRLDVIPSSNPQAVDMGVKLEYCDPENNVPNYESGKHNAVEIERVKNVLLDLIKKYPEKSIGIATMNARQKEALQQMLWDLEEKDEAKDPHDQLVANYINNWKSKNEGLDELFVRSLEEVQGDERDIIIVSTVYGPNTNGDIAGTSLNMFGRTYGRNNLNVLVTRARDLLVLVTSMHSGEIEAYLQKRAARGDLEENPGIALLSKYLAYAEGNYRPIGEKTNRNPANGFEELVGRAILDADPDYRIDYQVSASKYYIDIGVKHRKIMGGKQYIMAVECDGAPYHSSKSSQDADLLRQKRLEGLGWTFHRVWSTKWFRERRSATEDLLEALSDRTQDLLS